MRFANSTGMITPLTETPHDGKRGDTLAAAGFTDNPDHFPGFNLEAYIVNSPFGQRPTDKLLSVGRCRSS